MTGARWARPSPVSATVISMAVLLVAIVAIAYFYPAKTADATTRTRIDIDVNFGETVKVSFIGDSMTYGLYASEQSLGFHQLMVQEWRNDGPVAESAVITVGGTVAATLTANEFPKDQQLYVIELGTNDATRVDYGTFRTQYRDLVDRILLASPNTQLFCIGVWRAKQVADVYDMVIKDACETHGGVFRSVTDLSVDPNLKGPAGVPTFAGPSDTFHPNNAGHRMIADRMLKAVTIERTL